jgi:hypothetical protein
VDRERGGEPCEPNDASGGAPSTLSPRHLVEHGSRLETSAERLARGVLVQVGEVNAAQGSSRYVKAPAPRGTGA